MNLMVYYFSVLVIPLCGVSTKSCVLNSECEDHQHCELFSCHDVCEGACGVNALCKVSERIARCECPEFTEGDPRVWCQEKLPCLTSIDCPEYQHCASSSCQDVCEGACGIDAICLFNDHQASCVCPDQLEGDPAVLCHEKERHSITIYLVIFGVCFCVCLLCWGVKSYAWPSSPVSDVVVYDCEPVEEETEEL